MFGDNQTLVNSCSMPHARLHKRHVIISFHWICEAVAAKILHFIHMPGANNPADVLSKLWGYGSICTCLKAMLFWQGDTAAPLSKSLLIAGIRGVVIGPNMGFGL